MAKDGLSNAAETTVAELFKKNLLFVIIAIIYFYW